MAQSHSISKRPAVGGPSLAHVLIGQVVGAVLVAPAVGQGYSGVVVHPCYVEFLQNGQYNGELYHLNGQYSSQARSCSEELTFPLNLIADQYDPDCGCWPQVTINVTIPQTSHEECPASCPCEDANNNGVCDDEEDPPCVDVNNNGVCDDEEDPPCVDADNDGICDDEDDCVDADADGVCDHEDSCVDADGNGICDDAEPTGCCCGDMDITVEVKLEDYHGSQEEEPDPVWTEPYLSLETRGGPPGVSSYNFYEPYDAAFGLSEGLPSSVSSSLPAPLRFNFGMFYADVPLTPQVGSALDDARKLGRLLLMGSLFFLALAFVIRVLRQY